MSQPPLTRSPQTGETSKVNEADETVDSGNAAKSGEDDAETGVDDAGTDIVEEGEE